MEQDITAINEASCSKKIDDSYLDIVTGCLSGGWKSGTGLIQGFVELVKLLLIEAPAWAWDEANKSIEKLLKADLNPIEMSLSIARINLSSQSSIWSTAKKYWDEFLKFSEELKNTLMSEIKSFPCLPLEKQSEIICKGVTDVFLLVVSPAKFVQGAKIALNTTRALKNFVSETKLINGLEKATLENRLKLAAIALKETSQPRKQLLLLKESRLHEVELPDGTKVLKYSKNITDKNGIIHHVTQDVPVDAKTLAIDSNSTIGKEILNNLVKEKAGTSSLIFVDVNNLGKTNYFAGGTQTGDQYLTSVGESLRKAMRPGDMIFKNGGDELVIVLGSNNPQMIKQISQRMINEVDYNPQIRHIFSQEIRTSVKQYRAVKKAEKIEDLPEVMKKILSKADQDLAVSDFNKFKEYKLQEYLKASQEKATYRGSISIGSSLVKPHEDLSTVLKRAEEQASQVKAEYKQRLGQDISKYNVEVIERENIRKWSPPQALEPN